MENSGESSSTQDLSAVSDADRAAAEELKNKANAQFKGKSITILTYVCASLGGWERTSPLRTIVC
jgi:hypothetical protein